MNPIHSDPEILGSAPCFSGTRLPIKNLFDLLERGRDLNYFLSQFPTVTRDQAIAVLETPAPPDFVCAHSSTK